MGVRGIASAAGDALYTVIAINTNGQAVGPVLHRRHRVRSKHTEIGRQDITRDRCALTTDILLQVFHAAIACNRAMHIRGLKFLDRHHGRQCIRGLTCVRRLPSRLTGSGKTTRQKQNRSQDQDAHITLTRTDYAVTLASTPRSSSDKLDRSRPSSPSARHRTGASKRHSRQRRWPSSRARALQRRRSHHGHRTSRSCAQRP